MRGRSASISGERQQQCPTPATTRSSSRLLAVDAARLPEAGRKDQPAWTQVLDGDLSGVLLVDRGHVIERARPSSFMSSSLSIGKRPRASARLTTTRSTPCFLTSIGMSSTVPMTPGLSTGVPTGVASAVDEADDLDASSRRSCSSRASDTAAAFVPMISRRSRGPTARGQPFPAQSPADDQRDDQDARR